ncbi:MAG: ketoacyl reductase [Adhaeribacter sp.]|nr:ketoacyl reductase [Adhaeribacter sp.]
MNEEQRKNMWLALAGTGAAFLGLRALGRRRHAYNFKGKVVIITGGSRGLGLVLARRLAKEGAQLAICARNPEELESARQELSRSGARVLAQPCDVRQEDEVNRFVWQVEAHFGRVDVLINNAGVIQAGPLENQDLADFREAMDTHYWGPLYFTLAVLPGMKQRREGRIVNIASIGGKISVPHMVPYSGSKFALVGLSEGLRAELAQYNIPVTTINPWLMRTGSTGHAVVKGQHEKEYAVFTALDSFPLISISAEKSARKIIEACRQGDAELTLSVYGKLAALVHGISPGFITEYFGLMNNILPDPGSNERQTGEESKSELVPGWAQKIQDKNARKNNE